MPNGITDNVTRDDTLQITPLGCSANLAGLRRVGLGGHYPNINTALDIIRTCGLSGDLTLQLKGTFTESINLSSLGSSLNAYRLNITSFDNHPDSAIIIPPLEAGVILGNNKNITLRAITIDVSEANRTYAVQFTAGCSNIVIRDCKLLADTTTTNPAAAIVYKASMTGILDSIFIINNLLNGGHHGFSFEGGTGTSQYGTNIVLDSNILSNQYYFGIEAYYTDFTSCSYNTILSRREHIYTSWYGIRTTSSNGHFIANRIIQRSAKIASSYGIVLFSHNYYNTTATALITNNEVILNTANGTSGIEVECSRI
jgi:hypothetical protein